jgi:hypothetical protein
MRKRTKKKRCSCAMCKPHKTGGACRWTPKEQASIREAERQAQDARRQEDRRE